MDFNEAYQLFKNEFGDLSDKFKCLELSVKEAYSSDEDCVWHPGVYVWTNRKDGVLRVGRSLDNSRKRALEHIRDNTGGEIEGYSKDPETSIYLFNVRDHKHYHWVAALEIFFENSLNPKLKAGRQG